MEGHQAPYLTWALVLRGHLGGQKKKQENPWPCGQQLMACWSEKDTGMAEEACPLLSGHLLTEVKMTVTAHKI